MRTSSLSALTLTITLGAALALVALAPDAALARVVDDVPEIDPGVMRSALAVVAGGVAMLADHLRRC